mgnify:CR=1 FL=1
MSTICYAISVANERLRSLGSGESGIRPLFETKYVEPCDVASVVAFFCSYYNVPEPKLVRRLTTKNDRSFRGRYNNGSQTISFNRDYTGLVIHELAHHIVNRLRGVAQQENGHHNRQYWTILQELIDLGS